MERGDNNKVKKQNKMINDNCEIGTCKTWTKCVFDGNPPHGHSSWSDWIERSERSGVYAGIKVSSI